MNKSAILKKNHIKSEAPVLGNSFFIYIMSRRKPDAALFHSTYRLSAASETGNPPGFDFSKNNGSITIFGDQINLSL